MNYILEIGIEFLQDEFNIKNKFITLILFKILYIIVLKIYLKL